MIINVECSLWCQTHRGAQKCQPPFFPFATLFPSGSKGQNECRKWDRVKRILNGCGLTALHSNTNEIGSFLSFFLFFFSKKCKLTLLLMVLVVGCLPVLVFLPSPLALAPPIHPYSQVLPPAPPQLCSLSSCDVFCTVDKNKKILTLSALFVLQGMDQILPFFPFIRRHFEVVSTYFLIHSLVLLSLQVLQSFFCQGSLPFLCSFSTQLLFFDMKCYIF